MARRIALVLLLAAFMGGAAAGQLVVRVVDASGKPVADAVVTLRSAAAQAAKATPAHVRRYVDQRNQTFMPYLQVLRPGDDVVFRNSDRTFHHVYSFSTARTFEFVLAPGNSSPFLRLDRTGAIAVGCNIHDQMIAYLYVTDAPRFGQTGPSGAVVFEGLQTGDYDVHAWQPRLRPGRPEPEQSISVSDDTKSISFNLTLLPDVRQRTDHEHVHY